MPISPSQLTPKGIDESQIKDGSITDNLLGSRTVDQNTAFDGNSGTLIQILSNLAKEIEAVKGSTTNWYDTPISSISNLYYQDVIQSGVGYMVQNNGAFTRTTIYRSMILKEVQVSATLAPTASTRIDVYKGTTLLGYFSMSTQNTTWAAPANTNLVAGDTLYCKVNGTSGLKKTYNLTTTNFRLANK